MRTWLVIVGYKCGLIGILFMLIGLRENTDRKRGGMAIFLGVVLILIGVATYCAQRNRRTQEAEAITREREQEEHWCGFHSFPSTKSTTQHPRTCGSGPQHWDGLSM